MVAGASAGQAVPKAEHLGACKKDEWKNREAKRSTFLSCSLVICVLCF